MKELALGLDFGTESARAVLVSVSTGETVATRTCAYPDGVIDRCLPRSEQRLPAGWALQNPEDWLAALEATVSGVLEDSRARPDMIAGIGAAFTSCTILPCLADGTPLCTLEAFRDEAHAWPKLWKHHAAQRQAQDVNALAAERQEKWLPRYGGRISAEWLLPKALELLEAAPSVYSAADAIVEGCDWVVWQLTSRLARSACAAGYKACWHKQDGFPSSDFLKALHGGLGDLFCKKLAGRILAPGTIVGGLSEAWARRLELAPQTPVSTGIIDAHAAVVGGGVNAPGTMFMIMGTSTCHMLLSREEVLVEGISGVVEDGIVSGFFGYEAGQASVGDVFSWYAKNAVPPAYHQEAQAEGSSVHEVLSAKAQHLRPGESGLLALDWWNGCRTPLVDADLSGVVLGYSLQTLPEEVYRSLIEATAFGTRLIVELFKSAGVPVTAIRAAGGLTKNPFLLQVYADVLGLPIEVAPSEQVTAHGAAILGAVAGHVYNTVVDGIGHMSAVPATIIRPNEANSRAYAALYREYCRLVELFGRDGQSVIKRLREIKSASSSQTT